MICNAFYGTSLGRVPPPSEYVPDVEGGVNRKVKGLVSHFDRKWPRIQEEQLNRRAEHCYRPDAAKNRPTSKVTFLI
jgi:hypothetical protein